MFRVVICEDEDIHRKILSDYVIKIFKEINAEIELMEFESGDEILSSDIEFKSVDIFLLDIQMDGIDGMELAKNIRSKSDSSEIIFITSLINYIQDGYIVRAYRYLLKPLEYEELKKHLFSCISDIRSRRENYIIIENKGIIHKVLIKDIMYIDVIKKDLSIYTQENIYHSKNSLDRMEKELEKYNFYRCHKSYLVNLEYIDTIKGNTVFIGDYQIPVSKYRISNLKKKITIMLGDVIC
ncbi:response regulator transcription factor [Peptacetobacter hominis]|uniref:Stage 0 sporulation protein A homolog n=1 Tax=Peptacetobacter hominis TaxID=2743610 RepID=A0A544QUD3_9FIRM|nr:LytTR family DNA-binding domain-containing protein [Peptacetobacter hominis]TQQ84277.1 response regulator transcription factor [Peptacetobacter hominis]